MSDLDAGALHQQALAAYQQGRIQEASDLLSRALVADPKLADAHLLMSVCHHTAGRLDEAMNSIRRAIELAPDRSHYHAGLGVLLQNQGASEPAIAAYRSALELDANDAFTMVNLAHLLIEGDRLDEAEAIARRATQIMPDLALAHYKLGVALERQSRADESIAAVARSLELDPRNGDAQSALGVALLRRGDLKRGWEKYEWRFASNTEPASMPKLSSPRWDGSPMPGKTLLIQTEQGLGDAIHFARFAFTAAERFGGRVILRCDPRLFEVLRTLGEPIEIASESSTPPKHDVHVPLMSLGHVLGIDAVPEQPPYLSSEPQRAAQWAQQLAEHPRPRVGICWAGNVRNGMDRRRSIDPKQLVRLAIAPGVTWVSLQKDPRGSPVLPVVDFTSELTDFAETAALMSQLDLVLSVDTSVVHLAGALGRPVWTMLARVADWRWGIERDDTPWYPSMRLFRQPAPGNWDAVLDRVASELVKWRAAL